MDLNEKIIEIFNNMNFESKTNPENNSNDQSSNKFSPDDMCESLKTNEKSKLAAKSGDNLESGYRTWKQTPLAYKSDLLYKVSECLKDKSKLLPNLKNELSILSDYFAFYSDITEQIPKKADAETGAEKCRIVCVILSSELCFFVLGATVPAALASGFSVRVYAEKQPVIPLLLQKILIEAGLPNGVFTVGMIGDMQEFHTSLSDYFLHVVYCGPFLESYSTVFFTNLYKYFSPNHTTALVLESCDLNAAVTEIFSKTWESVSFCGVSTTVVQESILHNFLDLLRFKMKHFIIKNNDRSKFKDKKISERIHAVIFKALKAGATVEKAYFKDNEWGPVALINHQFEEVDLPILNVLVCRTPKEGVKLLNNCCYSLGTSIWSEMSAQALEIASKLESPNIWINCHGMFDARVPLIVSGLSGNCVLGGTQGLLEYLYSDRLCYLPEESHNILTIQESEVFEVAISAQKAFDLWHPMKNKRKYFKALADSLEKEKEFSESLEIFRNITFLTNRLLFHEKNHTNEFFIIHKEAPIGVICLFLNKKIRMELLSLLIAFPIKLGNAVIIVTEIENSYLTRLTNLFNKIFPKNLLSVINNEERGVALISNPVVKAVWFDNPQLDRSLIFTFQTEEEPSKMIPHSWLVDENILKIPDLIYRECTKRQVIWLPKVEKFP